MHVQVSLLTGNIPFDQNLQSKAKHRFCNFVTEGSDLLQNASVHLACECFSGIGKKKHKQTSHVV